MAYLISDGKNSNSSNAKGMTNLFNSKPKVRMFRSNMARRRKCLDHLEQLFKDCLPLLQLLSETNSSSAEVFKDYLTWIQSQLRAFKENPQAKLPHSLDSDIAQFNTKFGFAFNYLNLLSKEYNKKKVTVFSKHKVRLNLVPEVQYNLNLFVGKSLVAYPAFIDVYGLWLSPSELSNIIFKKEYDYLSYSVLALVAKHILPEKSHEYNIYYPTFLERSINSISQCYTTPSIEGVVSLCFIATIYIAEHNFKTALAYFTSALKMFQIIDHEKSAKYFMSVFKKNHLSKIESLRNALTLTSTIFYALMPDAPPFEFDSQPITLKLDANTHQKKLDYVNAYGGSTHTLNNHKVFSLQVENKLMENFATITSHIQMVRKKYRPFDQPELVPPFELRLPLEKYNEMFKFLLDLEEKFENELKTRNSLSFAKDFHSISSMDSNCTFDVKSTERYETHVLFFIHSLLVLLIYPSVLVAPRPILFSLYEMEILFNAANATTQYLFNIFLQHKVLQSQLLSSKLTQNSPQEKVNEPFSEPSPYPIEIVYPILVYLNLISSSQEPSYSSFSKDYIVKCKSVTLNVFKMLRQLSQSDIGTLSSEFILVIDKVAKFLPNYNLPKPFLDAAMEVLGINNAGDNQVIATLPQANKMI